MSTFDEKGALDAGYTPDEIAQFKARLASTDFRPGASGSQALAAGGGDTGSGAALAERLGLPASAAGPLQPVGQGIEGAGRGIVHTANRAGNLVGAVPDQTLNDEAQIDKPLLSTGAGQIGNLIGETAATAPIGMGVGGAIAKTSGTGAKLMANILARGATEGGVQGAVTSDQGHATLDAGLGAVGGGLVSGLASTRKMLANGVSRTPSAQALLDSGVDLTPGLMNPHGFQNAIEDQAEHVPGGESIFHGPREAARRGYERAVIEKGAVPGTSIKQGALGDMLQQASDSYTPLYDQARGFPVKAQMVTTAGAQPTLRDMFNKAAKLPGTNASVQKSESSWLNNELNATMAKAKAAGGMTSDHLLDLQSTVRARARDAAMKSDAASEDRAAIHRVASDRISDVLDSQLPNDAMNAKRTADSLYGRYKVVEDAVAKSKDQLGGLTPQKLSQSIYDASQNPGYAKGKMGNLDELRKFAQAGQEVFQKQPLTGMRAVSAAPLAYIALNHKAIGLPIMGTAIAGAATETGRRFAQGATKAQQLAQALGSKIDANVPAPVQGVGRQYASRLATALAAPRLPGAASMAASLYQASKQHQEEAPGK